MADLLAAVIRLRPLEEAVVAPWLGAQARGWLLGAVKARHPHVSAELHRPNQPNAYTVSELLGVRPARAGPPTVSPALEYAVRITSLHSGLTRCLLDDVLPALAEDHKPDGQESVVLGGVPFSVTAVVTDGKLDPLAGRSSDAELFQRHALGANASDRQIGLHFDSPTVFRSEGRPQPFPLPPLIFGSLGDRWNHFNDIRVMDGARLFAQDAVELRHYELRTRLVVRDQDHAVEHTRGFMGFARYVAHRHDQYWLGVLNLLAAYAFFSGVGKHTTEGFGRVWRV